MQNDVLFRDTIKDLSIFRLITENKNKGKAPASKNPDTEEGLNGSMMLAEGLLAELDITPASFSLLYAKVLAAMDKVDKASHRRSPDLCVRLVSMSALLWNHKSKARPRDWGLIAVAFALEAAYILTYRQHLLLECPGARLLRTSLYELFFPLAAPFVHPVTYLLTTTWEFADGLQVTGSSSVTSPVPFDDLLSRWKFARKQYMLGEKDPAFDLIRTLERNKYLQSAVNGSLEALAHHYVSGLAEVRPPFPSLPSLTRSP